MTLDEIFERMPQAFRADAAAGVDATIQFNAGAPRHIVVRDGQLQVASGAADNPGLTVTMDEDDLRQMLLGELDGMSAFMTGKLQIDGDMMLAQQMGSFFDAGQLGG